MKNFGFRKFPIFWSFYKIEFSFFTNNLKRKNYLLINDIESHIKNNQNKAMMFFKNKVYFFVL